MAELRTLTRHSAVAAEKQLRDRRQRQLLRTFLPEMVRLERMLAEAPETARVSVTDRVDLPSMSLPIYRVDLGSESPDAPALLLVGGVHGLERIGSQVVPFVGVVAYNCS